MHKKTVVALVVLGFSIQTALPVFAQTAVDGTSSSTSSSTSTSTSTQEDSSETKRVREEKRTERAELKEQIQTKKTELAQKRLEFKASKEKMVEEKCKNLETKIATRLGRYENNQQMIQTVYGNMQTRLTRLLEKLKTAGADTAKLEADLKTLTGKIEKFKTDQASFMTTLKESQAFACGKSEGEFKTKIDSARQVPTLLKQDRQDIKDFFETTIKTDLQAIRKTLAEQKDATIQ
ncbi:MAG: hypothetical protein WCJ51_01625 [Candidatus Moraniibacteriota bacterium]